VVHEIGDAWNERYVIFREELVDRAEQRYASSVRGGRQIKLQSVGL